MSQPLDQLPRKVANAFRTAGLQPYRTNTTTGIRAFFRDREDAQRAAEIMRRMGYQVDVLRDPKIKGGWQAYGQIRGRLPEQVKTSGHVAPGRTGGDKAGWRR
jgi:hypothetical protein